MKFVVVLLLFVAACQGLLLEKLAFKAGLVGGALGAGALGVGALGLGALGASALGAKSLGGGGGQGIQSQPQFVPYPVYYHSPIYHVQPVYKKQHVPVYHGHHGHFDCVGHGSAHSGGYGGGYGSWKR